MLSCFSRIVHTLAFPLLLVQLVALEGIECMLGTPTDDPRAGAEGGNGPRSDAVEAAGGKCFRRGGRGEIGNRGLGRQQMQLSMPVPVETSCAGAIDDCHCCAARRTRRDRGPAAPPQRGGVPPRPQHARELLRGAWLPRRCHDAHPLYSTPLPLRQAEADDEDEEGGEHPYEHPDGQAQPIGAAFAALQLDESSDKIDNLIDD